MKKHLLVVFCFLSVCFLSTASAQNAKMLEAAPQKTILLKDGTKLKGKIVGVNNNVYTVETSHFGRVEVQDDDISSISASDASEVHNQAAPQGMPSTSANKEQIQMMQNQILSDPEILTDLQEMSKDPDMQQMLSDPELMRAVTNYDTQSVQNNPRMQQLLANPKMKRLVEKIQAKQSAQPTAQ